MKDIDFDELDQAVSSVLKTPGEKTATPDVAPAAATPDVEKPAEKTAEKVESAPEPAAAPTKTPLAIKRRGQFMDVVHPSSDMTGKPGDLPVAPAPKVSIQPISPSVEPEAPAETPVEPTEAAPETAAPTESHTPEAPQAPIETVEPPAADRSWPDPLDTMETQEETKDSLAAPTAALEDTAVEAVTTPDVAAETPEEPASDTPFLADTKVEKRPLDAFSVEETPGVVDPATAAAPTELPPELQPEVIAVEANSTDQASEDVEETPAPVEKESTPEPSFNASIPQQYVAEENQADEDHSIFDTREYHQPLTPTKAKKNGLPGWLVALFVVILLAGLGAAGGYFWFYYGP